MPKAFLREYIHGTSARELFNALNGLPREFLDKAVIVEVSEEYEYFYGFSDVLRVTLALEAEIDASP